LADKQSERERQPEPLEKQWIKQIQKRHNRKSGKEAANLLVSSYYDEIYRYAYKQTFGKDIALDLTQDIFIAALLSINQYDPKKAGFRTWLYKIATNKLIDYKRSYRNLTVSLDDAEIPVELDYPAIAENKILASKIEAHISRLSYEKQEIFRLKVYAGYTFAQIAGLLSMPENTVKTMYYRLLGELRKEFEGEYKGE